MTSPVRAAACAGCGSALLPGSVVCPGCGLARDQGQRRFVAVLFADLAGYTALCESRDPEEVHLLIRPMMNALRAHCERRGAVVPGVQGDGFMALFGAVAAHEDDPDRALQAAAAVLREVAARREVLPELPQVRVGLHVGEVVVGPAGHLNELTVSGDAVNVASRVCGQADPGELLVTAQAVALLGTADLFDAPRELRLKGREAAVTARRFPWQKQDAVGRAPRWSSLSPYVPRPEVEQALATALDRHPVVVLRGDAGMGKSRLARHVLSDRRTLQASTAHGMESVAATLCADLLDQQPVVAEDLVRLLRSGGSTDLTDEVALIRAAGARLSGEPPGTVVFIDDAERLTDDDLTLLAEAMRASGLSWLLASRSSLPAAGEHEVVLPPWRAEETDVLLEATLPRASRELRQAVLQRAGDCPLYVEQCMHLLLDNGAVVVDAQGARVVDQGRLGEIPSSMRLFVSSRLDLLAPPERALLGVAAVLGPEPDLALLEHLSPSAAEHVDGLVERGFLRWRRGAAGQPELSFTHALVRDVAYETLLRGRRVEIHRAAAEWYAVLPVSQVLESQAYHLEAAVLLEEPDCDLLRRTIDAMVLYARSIEDERTRTSLDVLRRARALVESREDCSVDTLLLELAWASVNVLGGAETVARTAAATALDMAVQRNDSRAQAEAHLHLARSHRYQDEAVALTHLQAAAAAYEQVDDPAGGARVEIERGILAEHDTGIVQYLDYLERAYQLAMRSADVRLQATCAQWLTMHQAFAYGRDGYLTWSEQARAVSRRDDVGLEPRIDLAAGALAMFDLDPGTGLEPAQRALSAGRDLGLSHVYSNALVVTTDLLVLLGQVGPAEDLITEARRYASTRPTPWYALQFHLIEARLRLRQGQPAAAAALLDEVASHELAEQKVLRRDLAEARAWVALERGRFGEARALAAEALIVDEELGERCAPLRPRLINLVASVAAGESIPLGTIASLRQQARETGLGTIAQLATRWLYVDELTHGWTVDLHGLSECGVVECRALDLEIEALSTRDWSLLLRAAEVWAELGTTVWRARALLWHSELTRTSSDEGQALLEELEAPAELGEFLRAQVRPLVS